MVEVSTSVSKRSCHHSQPATSLSSPESHYSTICAAPKGLTVLYRMGEDRGPSASNKTIFAGRRVHGLDAFFSPVFFFFSHQWAFLFGCVKTVESSGLEKAFKIKSNHYLTLQVHHETISLSVASTHLLNTCRDGIYFLTWENRLTASFQESD